MRSIKPDCCPRIWVFSRQVKESGNGKSSGDEIADDLVSSGFLTQTEVKSQSVSI
jgi:hypothetical protein